MFIKTDQLKELLPKDNLHHELQIVNDCLVVDGELVYATKLKDETIRCWDWMLTRKELQVLANANNRPIKLGEELKDVSADWHCKEFSLRLWVEIKEHEEIDMFVLHSFMIEHEMPKFDFRDCVFIDGDGKAFYPEPDFKFSTEDCCWYIKPPKKFYIYSGREDKYEWKDYVPVGGER